MELTAKQYKLLKRIKRKKVILTSKLKKKWKPELSMLNRLGYVLTYGVGNDGIDSAYYETRIEEAGKMYIATRKMNNRRFFIPVLISILALFVSIFALFKSSQPIQITIDSTNKTAVSTNEPAQK